MMKNSFLIIICMVLTQITYAKKVKFGVNMSGQTISPNGIHVSGDFQTAAGFSGGNWQSDVTKMTQETADTNIYSVIVDIPAFAKYEYKFVNGDKFYEVEFVPVESRVGYNFNDNRWIYVDSLANDTTYVGAIMFGGNAPAGLTLVRCIIDMQTIPNISNNGVHLAGSFQKWSPTATRLYSFGDSIYEIISYVDTGIYEYKYFNGNTANDAETVPSACATNNNRTIAVLKDTVLNAVCYGKCGACFNTGFSREISMISYSIFPNPSSGWFTLYFNDLNQNHHITLYDAKGAEIGNFDVIQQAEFTIEKTALAPGVYYVGVNKANSYKTFQKVVIN